MEDPNPFSREEFYFRSGTFMVWVGFILLIYFLLSESANQPAVKYFCLSTLLFTLGFMIRVRYRRAINASSGRFSVLNKFKKGSKK